MTAVELDDVWDWDNGRECCGCWDWDCVGVGVAAEGSGVGVGVGVVADNGGCVIGDIGVGGCCWKLPTEAGVLGDPVLPTLAPLAVDSLLLPLLFVLPFLLMLPVVIIPRANPLDVLREFLRECECDECERPSEDAVDGTWDALRLTAGDGGAGRLEVSDDSIYIGGKLDVEGVLTAEEEADVDGVYDEGDAELVKEEDKASILAGVGVVGVIMLEGGPAEAEPFVIFCSC